VSLSTSSKGKARREINTASGGKLVGVRDPAITFLISIWFLASSQFHDPRVHFVESKFKKLPSHLWRVYIQFSEDIRGNSDIDIHNTGLSMLLKHARSDGWRCALPDRGTVEAAEYPGHRDLVNSSQDVLTDDFL
jgi:hypothetical protein